MCWANNQVSGIATMLPTTIEVEVDNTGRPAQLPMSDAKKVLTAIAPAPKG